MGQKVNPKGFRTGPTLFNDWDAVLYAEGDYSKRVSEDLYIRKIIKDKYKQAYVAKVKTEWSSNKLVVNIHAKKPGIIIGKSGTDIEKLKKDIEKKVNRELFINIHEVKKWGTDAVITAETIAQQLENRVSYKKAMRTAMKNCITQGGSIKVEVSGRVGGAEIARSEWYREGRVPLHTLRADIDYGTAEANTTYGVLGVKVWIYRGDFKSKK
ncbi:MAG: 30S ribosomal protein S3 [Rickettsiaceae bacterium]|nr:30S ribosomal protein S3 [Rickettsiaceae bacterium]